MSTVTATSRSIKPPSELVRAPTSVRSGRQHPHCWASVGDEPSVGCGVRSCGVRGCGGCSSNLDASGGEGRGLPGARQRCGRGQVVCRANNQGRGRSSLPDRAERSESRHSTWPTDPSAVASGRAWIRSVFSAFPSWLPSSSASVSSSLGDLARVCVRSSVLLRHQPRSAHAMRTETATNDAATKR